jgi:hypothetical protein
MLDSRSELIKEVFGGAKRTGNVVRELLRVL